MVNECHELQASAYLNMSICFFKLDKFEKSKEKALLSIQFKKSVKAYFRLAIAQKSLKDYEGACANLKICIVLDANDDNLKKEMTKCVALSKEKEKLRQEKLMKAFAGNM